MKSVSSVVGLYAIMLMTQNPDLPYKYTGPSTLRGSDSSQGYKYRSKSTKRNSRRK